MSDQYTRAHRRHILQLFGSAAVVIGGGVSLSGCGGEGGSPSGNPTPTPTTAVTAPGAVQPGPDYTATETDRLNFALQINYLLAAYLFRGVFGGALPVALTSGSGASGGVSGGAQVAFSTAGLAESLREMAYDLQAHVGFLRGVLAGATTAQPAISIAGGAGGPFQAIASLDAYPASAPFDPYASETSYLIGLVALTGTLGSALIDVTRLIGDRTVQANMGGMLAAAAQHDVVTRLALYAKARADTTLFTTLNRMSDARDVFDGNRGLDEGVGSNDYFEMQAGSNDGNALRRTPEQALNIFYANRTSVTSGGFFPAGINGVIRASGSSAA